MTDYTDTTLREMTAALKIWNFFRHDPGIHDGVLQQLPAFLDGEPTSPWLVTELTDQKAFSQMMEGLEMMGWAKFLDPAITPTQDGKMLICFISKHANEALLPYFHLA